MNRPPAGGADPTVTVVICAYTEERWGDLCAAVAGLRVQTCPPQQLVVVVDHCPALLERAREASRSSWVQGPEVHAAVHAATWAPGIQVVASTQPAGLSGARNTGVELAVGDVVAFLDDDAVPEPDWLERLVAPFADPTVVAVGGTALARWPGDGRPAWWPPEFDWVVGCSHRGLPAAGEVRNVLGATMAFRASVFAEGLRFDDHVGRVAGRAAASGCEETELCIRVRQRHPDARILLQPTARVWHRVGPERAHLSYFVRRCYAEGRSKAAVTRLVGSMDGLATERAYTLRTLPVGVLRGLRDTVHRDPDGAARAGVIAVGLAATTAGYLRGRINRPRPTTAPSADFEPVRLLQLELTDPGLVGLAPTRVAGLPYRRARVLVREHGRPVGAADVPLTEGTLDAATEAQIRAEFEAAPADAHPTGQPDGDDEAKPGGLDVTVVVATRDRPDGLARCLDSVLATKYPDLRVVVVDNAPTSATTRQRLQENYPEVGYVLEPVPGLARAHNRGLEQVDTPIVAFTDDDVVVDPDWLHTLVAQFAASERIGCVTGLIWPAELDTPAQLRIEDHGSFGKGFAWQMFNLNGSRPDDPLFPYTAGALGSGANMAFRTAALRAVGGFDPALGIGSPGRGGDDLAAFYDVVTGGWTLVYEPAAVVHHHHRRDDAAVAAQAVNYGAGLGAYLTRVAVRRPAALLDFVRLAPRALAHLIAGHDRLAPSAPGGVGPTSDGLLTRQLVGMARGPVGYVRGTRQARRAAHPPGGTP